MVCCGVLCQIVCVSVSCVLCVSVFVWVYVLHTTHIHTTDNTQMRGSMSLGAYTPHTFTHTHTQTHTHTHKHTHRHRGITHNPHTHVCVVCMDDVVLWCCVCLDGVCLCGVWVCVVCVVSYNENG